MRDYPFHTGFFLRVLCVLALTITSLSLTAAPIRTVHAQTAIACGDTAALIDAIDTGMSVINLAAGCPAPYSLTADHPDSSDGSGNFGLPDITTTITINGNGAAIQRASSTPDFGIFYVATAGSLTLNNVTISGGEQSGIVNYGGSVTLNSSTLSNNSGFIGGGILNLLGGTVHITGSTLSGNSAALGGGIATNSGLVEITSSTFSGNRVTWVGGGIYNSLGITTVNSSTFSGNQAARAGGGIASAILGNLTLTNSILSANSAPVAGGIYLYSGPILTNDNRNVRFSIQQQAISDSITGSCIVNNTTPSTSYDVVAQGSESLDAVNNWWGDTSGPGGVAPGLGDTVSANIIYTPFLTAPAAHCAGLTSSTTLSGPNAGDHARAQAPLCADLSGTTSPVVRADVPGSTVPNGGVFCRIINENGSYRPASGAAEIGSASVISRGVLQAVDIFGQAGGTSIPRFTYPVRVCLLGSGSFLFLDALTQPRALLELPASLENGYTCATIPNAGTVVLVGSAPAITAPPASTGTALIGCMVTTNYLLNLRAAPSDSAAIITQVPYNVTLTATEHQGGWFHVDYLGVSGWLNAAYVVPSTGCG